MAWLELHQSIRDHRKIVELAEKLNITEPHAAGLCVYFWTWALDNAPDGIVRNSSRIICKAASWNGDQEAFLAAMIDVKFLETTDKNGDLYIHDWIEYVGRLMDQRESNKERQRRYREVKKAKKSVTPALPLRNALRNADVTVTSRVTLPLRNGATVPNSTVPKDKRHEEEDSASENSENGVAKLYMKVPEYYPRVNPTQLEKLSAYLTDDGMSVETVLLALDESRTRGKDIPYALAILRRWAQEEITTELQAKEHIRTYQEVKSVGTRADESDHPRFAPANRSNREPQQSRGDAFREQRLRARAAAGIDEDLPVPDLS